MCCIMEAGEFWAPSNNAVLMEEILDKLQSSSRHLSARWGRGWEVQSGEINELRTGRRETRLEKSGKWVLGLSGEGGGMDSTVQLGYDGWKFRAPWGFALWARRPRSLSAAE